MDECGGGITSIRCMYPLSNPTRHDRFSRVCEVDMWSYAWCTEPINDAWEKEKKSISKTCSWPLERS